MANKYDLNFIINNKVVFSLKEEEYLLLRDFYNERVKGLKEFIDLDLNELRDMYKSPSFETFRLGIAIENLKNAIKNELTSIINYINRILTRLH